MNGNALGLIETQGLVGLVSAVDAMLKAASVELASSVIKLDGGLVSVMVRGDVSSVRAAVEAGAEAAGRIGELKAAHVIPRPAPPSSGRLGEGRRVEDPRRQPRQHQLQVPPLRPRRPGGAPAVAGIDRADRLGQRDGHDPLPQGRGRDRPADRRPRRRGAGLPRPVDRPRGGRPPRRVRGGGDRLQGGPRPRPERRPAGDRRGARGDGGVQRRRPRAQSPLRAGDADARRPLPGDPPGRGLRDRVPRDHPRGEPALRDPRRVGDRAGRPPLRVPRRQPPLHRRADGRAPGPR